MPTYEYECEDCGHNWDEVHDMNTKIMWCPECTSKNVFIVIQDVPHVFKCGGFYKTDNRKENNEKGNGEAGEGAGNGGENGSG